MGKVTMQGVQKILHLDTTYDNFQTWEETLKFKVDGIQVKAIATHAWREESVRIILPFQVDGRDYHQGFRPPLIALSAAMISRRRLLAERGLTVRDDCIRMATNTYCYHATYLRLKPEIDRQQQAYFDMFRKKLNFLLQNKNKAEVKFSSAKAELRKKLHAGQLAPKIYQTMLEAIREEAEECSEKHSSLLFDVESKLEKIKWKILDEALDPATCQYLPPLRLR